MTDKKREVLDFIQNLAVELKKVSDKNRKRREDIRNNPDMPIREQISASGEWRGMAGNSGYEWRIYGLCGKFRLYR